MIDKSTKEAFRLEEHRAELASQKKFKKLKSSYKKGLPEIEDLNTSELWDKLNEVSDYSYKNNPMAHDRIKIVADNIRKGSYKKVLNIGLGEGSLEREITDMYVRNKKWYGIDISKQTVQTCKERFSNGIFNIGSVSKLPYKSNYFDCIVALEVLEHIKPRKILKSLSEIQRVAKKDAILIISVPLNEGLLELVKKGSNPNAHLRVYTKELLSAELEIAGFRVYWEKYLFAFGKNYKIKTILCRYIYKSYRMPNVVIVKANKK